MKLKMLMNKRVMATGGGRGGLAAIEVKPEFGLFVRETGAMCIEQLE
jgi:hypothetical protein